ncbi:MAG: efflux RND transporter periplasmic adaptor subunit [Muribaculaceae bacterium]|nr:efflux RND transporter periplasmic adaptor subunit [Muribaculaceae bacterium]
MNIAKHNISLCAAIALALCACGKKQQVTLETATATKGEIVETVTATGTLESVTQVDVGTQVTGIVSKLFADYNSIVTAGQIIAEIDKTTLESDLKSVNATMESAKQTYEYTKKNFERDKALHEKQLISDYEFETSRKDYLVAKAAYEKSQSDRVKAARNLSYAEIYSPIDGIVMSREVEVGQTVVSNMSVANLFVIADLNNMRVVADVDEADIGSVKVGQNASFTVDAYPNDVFNGKVTQVRINPTTTSNVVTYEVLISTENPEHKLIPGLTANITINTKELKDVLTVPIKTLKFQPQEFEDAEGLPVVEEMPQPRAGADKPKVGDTPKDPVIPTEDMHRLLWVLRDGRLAPTEVEIGLDNGVSIAILNGLNEGDTVALQYNTDSEAMPDAAPQGGESPFMPKRPGSDKKKK